MGFTSPMTTTLTGHNQITVPAKLAKRFSLKPGTRIEWKDGGAPDEIICRILPDAKSLAEGLRGGGKKYLESAARHPLQALQEEREMEG
jgi:bifunctional DNA-binding transcriptional regulator/antitoxin component of YhaV-PrlF toxin-antitoxin module